MRFTLLHIIIYFIPAIGFTQETPIPAVDSNVSRVEEVYEEIICMCDIEAQYPGGSYAMRDFIQSRFTPPERITYYRQPGKRTYIAFTVSATGNIEDIEIERGYSEEIDQELLRIIKNMPDWSPNIRGCGEVYATRIRLPITINWL